MLGDRVQPGTQLLGLPRLDLAPTDPRDLRERGDVATDLLGTYGGVQRRTQRRVYPLGSGRPEGTRHPDELWLDHPLEPASSAAGVLRFHRHPRGGVERLSIADRAVAFPPDPGQRLGDLPRSQVAEFGVAEQRDPVQLDVPPVVDQRAIAQPTHVLLSGQPATQPGRNRQLRVARQGPFTVLAQHPCVGRRPTHRQHVCPQRHHVVGGELEAQRLAYKGWSAGQEREPVAGTRRGRRPPRRGCLALGEGPLRPRGERTRRPACSSRPAGGPAGRRRLGVIAAGAAPSSRTAGGGDRRCGSVPSQDEGRQPLGHGMPGPDGHVRVSV
jgi:hypothetical protein